MKATVYLLRCVVNGKVYVGVTKNFRVRLRGHSRAYNNYPISRAVRKYGWNSFIHEILYEGEDYISARDVWEPNFIKKFSSNDPNKGYNLTKGGQGTFGYVVSDETRAKQRQAKLGKKLSEPHRRGISNSNKGHAVSTETRKKISEQLKGNINSKGYKLSDEHKEIVRKRMSKTWTIEDVDGNRMKVIGLGAFCRERGWWQVYLSKTLTSGKYYKGWRVVSVD
jgi:group I intron endonuclease